MKKDRPYVGWGVTAFLVICGVILFYDLVFRDSAVMNYFNKLGEILAPVLYGVFLAYILTPVVNWFEAVLFGPGRGLRLGKRFPALGKSLLPRAVAILLTWVLVGLVLYVLLNALLPQLYSSILQLVSNAEGYYKIIYSWLQQLLTYSPETGSWLAELVNEYYQEALEWISTSLLPRAQQAVGAVTGGLLSVVSFLLDLLVGVIVSVYLLATKEGFAATGCKMLYCFFSQERAAWIIRGVKQANRIFSGFFRGKLLDSLIIGILCFIFSTIFEFPYAPLISVVIGVTNIIPFFGPFLGAVPTALLVLLVSPLKCLYFVLFVLALQQFDGNILGPKILGDSTGLTSFWVIVAILVGGGLWGVVGMFVGVPLFACVYTALRNYSAWRLARKGLPTETENYSTHAPVADPPEGSGDPE